MRIRAVFAALPLLVLAACGASSTAASTSGTATAASGAASSVASSSGAAASGTPAANLGPAVPAATVVAPAVAAAALPTATGKFGDKPALTYPKTTPPPSLQRTILTEGTGATTVKGDYLVTNYLGQIWNGKVFDNSYDRKATSTFQIGEGKVVPGWDVALVGVKVGSRVLLSLPPADGYGSAGSSSAGIKGTDTIVFVVDVVSRIALTTTGQADAVVQPAPKGVPTVTGAPGKEPKITIPKGLVEPTTNSVYLLAKGTGAKLKAGGVLAQLVVTDWTQTQTQSTWPKTGAAAATANPASTGLQQITVDATGALKGLVGIPIGSRVLVLIAASTNQSTGQQQAGAVAVVDVVAQA
ncbi:peptidylprolyl isomerase [Nakamurella sp. UYEF19]|uniref:FKBP-type peptidyl-prolyl cis-trans isomerase n=1 Tax=Nakamurella sp. UYEF19 TaxID=1756392 RepID=UPI00339AA601